MAASFENYSISQLKQKARANLRKIEIVKKNPASVRGLSVAQRKAIINREKKKITTALRRQALSVLRDRIKSCAPKSKKLRQLQAIKRKLSTCKKLETLLKLLVGFKASSGAASRKNSKQKSSSQIQTLQKENLILHKRNKFMQAQVAKFKKQVQMMGKDYGRYNSKVTGSFNTQCITSQQIQKLVLAAQAVVKSKNMSPQQKLQRVATKINKIYSIVSSIAKNNNIIKWPTASKKQVERDITNILKISSSLLRSQAKR